MKKKSGIHFTCILFTCLFLLCAPFFSKDAAGSTPRDEHFPSVYGKLPLYFIENKGQMDSKVRFYIKTSAQTLYFTDEGIVFDLLRKSLNTPKAINGERDGVPAAPRSYVERLVFSLTFDGAQGGHAIVGVGKQKATLNYLLTSDKSKWTTDIPTYESIVYKDIYKGTDFRVRGDGKAIKYEFILNPGADPADIALSYEGIEGLRTNGKGDLLISTAFGELRETKPYVYQEIDGGRTAVKSHFEIYESGRLGPDEKPSYGFCLAAYDTSYPIIIDPTLEFSTYLGGSSVDMSAAIALDGNGNAYVTGVTQSNDFPTQNPFQGNQPGGYDAFVTKLSPNGTALVYSTYLGGTGSDVGQGIAVDASGNAYVTGYTTSSDFPTQNPFQASLGDGRDAFVTKLSADGATLVYSTYLGGNSYVDIGNDITVDTSGNAYVTGSTECSDFPTLNPYQGNQPGGKDGFVTRFSQSGNTLVYSTYLGGSGEDEGNGIAIDSSGNAFVTGSTYSDNFPTNNSYQGARAGGQEGFVTKLTSAGNALSYSTYLGGTANDVGAGIALDTSGNAYISGSTGSADFPTQNPFQTDFGGGTVDAFVTKLNSSGNSLLYSTYLGGTASDQCSRIALDASGEAHVTGYSGSDNFPTKNPLQGTRAGGNDVFVAAFTTDGSGLLYSTFLGGSQDDVGYGIKLDASGNAYVSGYTYSGDFPTKNPYQQTLQGSTDAFVLKYNGTKLSPGTYYVDIENGSDSNDGSAGMPFKTLHHALSMINNGTPGTYTLIVAPGGSSIPWYSVGFGEADEELVITQDNVTIRGAAGGMVIIHGVGTEIWANGFKITGSNVTLENLYVTGFTQGTSFGIDIIAGTNNTVQNCQVYGNDNGISVWQSGNCTIQGCEIDNNFLDGISFSQSPDGMITQNTVHDNYDINESDGIIVQACNPEISQNTVYDNRFNISLQADSGETTSPTIKNNLVYMNVGRAERVDYGILMGGAGITAPVIYHNTIDGGLYDGIYMDSAGSTPDIKYNIVTNFGQVGIRNLGGLGSPTIDYNDIWGNGTGPYGNCGPGPNDIYQDPQYGSYTLQVTSPCINAISLTSGDPVTIDKNGDSRPYGAGYDMGCYESSNLPAVLTADASAITTDSAQSGGHVSSSGDETAITNRGVCWSTSPNPTTMDSHTSDGSGLGSFSSSITGLSPNTTYHVRAYATNGVEVTGYGSDKTFTTTAVGAPTVTTAAVTSVTTNSAQSGGDVTDDGGAALTARGVCWSTSPNPTTSDSHTSDGTATGTYNSSITGLSSNTTYHVRAYASNSNNLTGYGSDRTFTTAAPVPTVTSFSPTSGGTGTSVVIKGTGFTGTVVQFGGTPAQSFTIDSNTQITAIVGNGSTGKVTVTTAGGTGTSTDDFTYYPAPAVTSFNPTSGGTDTSVTITGTDFTGASAVKFGGADAKSFTVDSSTQITAIVGNGATGRISVTTPGGTGESNTDFTYTSMAPGAYYVNVSTGDDANNGSSARPWQTLHHAISQINTGSGGIYILYLAPGTYGVSTRALEREADEQMTLTQSNVIIAGDESNPPVIDGSAADNWTIGMEVTGSNNTIEHLWFTGFSDDNEEGVRISQGNGNEMRHCRAYGNNFGMRVVEATDTTIRNCEVFLNTTHGIDVVKSPETDVVDNKIYDNPQYGIRAEASAEISRNLIYDNDYGILVEALNGDSISPIVENNVIYQTAAGAMRYGIYTRAQNGSTINAQIYHNTMDNGTLNGITTENDNSSTSAPHIKYNIIVNFDQYGILNDGATPTIDYNDVWNNTAGNYEGCQKGTHDINKDPQFASYSLWKYSPCINTIPSTAGDPVVLDYPGFARPRPGETAKDMGAYEYVGTVSDPYTMPGGTGQTTDYRIFTVPFYMTGAEMLSDMEKVLGTYNNTTWRGFAMVDGAYVEFNETAFKNLSIIPGMGFWIITLLTDTIPFKGVIAPDSINYQLTLAPGWHLMGLPWVRRNIDLGNILVTDGLNVYTLTSAQNNLTQKVVWDFTGTGPYSGYEKRDVSTDELQCGTAYFIKVLSTQNVTLIIPYQNTRVRSIERGSTGDEEEPPPPPGVAQSQGCPEFVNGRLEGNITFPTNKNCSYQGASSYTLGPGVMIPEGAIVTIRPE